MEFLHRNINSNGTKTLVPTHISIQVKHCLVSSGTYILHTMYSMLNSRLAISQCSISTSLVPCHHDEEWNKGTNMADTICVKYTEIYKHTYTNMPVRTHTHTHTKLKYGSRRAWGCRGSLGSWIVMLVSCVHVLANKSKHIFVQTQGVWFTAEYMSLTFPTPVTLKSSAKSSTTCKPMLNLSTSIHRSHILALQQWSILELLLIQN